jgi:hypothetical protein
MRHLHRRLTLRLLRTLFGRRGTIRTMPPADPGVFRIPKCSNPKEHRRWPVTHERTTCPVHRRAYSPLSDWYEAREQYAYGFTDSISMVTREVTLTVPEYL